MDIPSFIVPRPVAFAFNAVVSSKLTFHQEHLWELLNSLLVDPIMLYRI